MKELKILIGSDPELFVFKDGEPVCAHGMVGGTKEQPMFVDNGAVQVDGMALEYNTDPAATLEEWENNHVSVQQQLEKMIPKKMTLEAVPTAFFSEKVFKAAPKESKVLGCDPDFNAYTADVNPVPIDNGEFRTGAGHIHIGWGKDFNVEDPLFFKDCCYLTKVLDSYVGVPSILVDSDSKRRELYGRAGCFRPKPYGLEYRTLSNFWISNKDYRRWVYNATVKAVKAAYASRRSKVICLADNVINTNNTERAKQLVAAYNMTTAGLL